MSEDLEPLPSSEEMIERICEKLYGPIVDLEFHRAVRKIEGVSIDSEHAEWVLSLFGV